MILKPYQVAAAEWLAERKSALLADEMRVGKTGAAIRACDLVGARRVLWLTTASAKTDHAKAWDSMSWLPVHVDSDYEPDDVGVLITNYDRLGARDPMNTGPFDVLVCDESHRLKTPDVKRTVAVYGEGCEMDVDSLAMWSERTWFLSGTPSPNGYPSELWTWLRATLPHLIPAKTGRPMSYWQFVNRYCKTKTNHFGDIKIVGGKNMAELKAKIAPYVLRRKLAEVMPELPPQSFDLVYFDAGDALRELELDWAIENLADKLDANMTDDDKLTLLQDIEQAFQLRLRRLTGMAKVKHVVEWVKDRLDGNNDKIVLFAHHKDVLDGLFIGLAKESYILAGISGATSAAARATAQEYFQRVPNCRVFIGQIQAAGEAIDLSAADEVMFVEASWVPKDNQQAAARVVNIGKNKPTFAWFASLADSIDEKIQRTVARKTADLAALFD